MVLKGKLWKEGKFWIIEVPDLDVTTQGRTRKEALIMIADAIESLVDKKGFKIKVSPLNRIEFLIYSDHSNELISFFLKRQREMSHLTIRELTKRLGYESPNAYAQYESGRHLPGLDKIGQFITAINPKTQILLGIVPFQNQIH